MCLLLHLSIHFSVDPYGGSDNSLLSHPTPVSNSALLCSLKGWPLQTVSLGILYPLASIWVWSMACSSSRRSVVGERGWGVNSPNPSSCYSSQSEWLTPWKLFSKSCLPAASVSPGSLLEMQSLRSYSRSTGVIGFLMQPRWLVLDGVWEPLIYSNRLFWLAPLHGFISKNPEIMFLPLALRPWCDNGFSLLLNPECLTIPCWFLNPDSHLLNIPFIEIFLARSFFFFFECVICFLPASWPIQ